MAIANALYAIVVGVDFSSTSERALEHAFDLAERHPHAQMHVIAVATGHDPALRFDANDADERLSADEAAKTLHDYVEKQLQKLQREPPVNLEHVAAHLGIGDPATEIAELAVELQADLIVVGTHGRQGIRRLVLGSVAEKVLRMAHAPVLIVRPKDYSGEPSAPKIDAPCPRCAETRKQSAGRELWCEQHSAVHGRRHTYHFARVQSAHNSGFLIPKFKA